jgi:hypothetical protein
MNKKILTILPRDEAVPFRVVEPLDSALFHTRLPSAMWDLAETYRTNSKNAS